VPNYVLKGQYTKAYHHELRAIRDLGGVNSIVFAAANHESALTYELLMARGHF
jgi:hypothetical protein